MNDEYIIVGKLGRTREVYGELYITPFTDFPDRFLGMTEIYVSSKNSWELKKIVSSRMIGDRPVIKFEGVTSLEAAASLTNRELAVKKSQLVELPDDRFYIFDLVGCEVFDDSTDETLGTIVDVEQYPANDVYVIETGDGSSARLPAVKQFVKSVDINGKRVTVDRSGMFGN